MRTRQSLAVRATPFWSAYQLWWRHDCIDLSAAFAYHSLQSLFPLALIALSIAARVLGKDEGLLETLLALAARLLPETAMPAVRITLTRFTHQGVGAGLLGVAVLLVTSSNAFLTLQRGADRLWWNRPANVQDLAWPQALRHFLRSRLQAFALVASIGLLVSLDQLAINLRLLAPTTLRDWTLARFPRSGVLLAPFTITADLLLSAVLVFIATILLLWLLPTKRVRWGPLIPGAGLIAVLLSLLNLLVGRSVFSLGSRFQAYGVVGGILVLTLWVWVGALVFYYGQCLSVVLASQGRFSARPHQASAPP